ncbi:MAG TPA: tetratricopeptide repeat protein [Bacteroidota bacterium]|nr:tetratricopeptide repeat protein [Bacteroidota bacterium]
MTKILQFVPKPPAKLDFEKVKKSRKGSVEETKDQLSLFAQAMGRVYQLPSNLSPFEQALLLDEKDDQRAAEAYWKAISADDSTADAYCNLGILEHRAGRTTKAFDCFTQALKLDPRHPESHYNLANLYFEAGDLRLAAAHYEMALEVAPEFPNVYFNLGLVHALQENYPRAIESLEKYKELVSPEEGKKAVELLSTLKRTISASQSQ